MSFFKKFPLFKGYVMNDNNYTVVDVSKRSFNKNVLFESSDYFIEYELKEGDTPVILADKLYDDAELAWTILYFNKIVDYYNEWPLEQESLKQYILRTYNDPYGIHHYVSIQTENIVGSGHPNYDKAAITNFEHEVAVNDEKRFIRLIRTDYIGEYVNGHDEEAQRL
jgi:hypothetical protein